MVERATVAAEKALELDPTLAQAHAARGVVQLFLEWDFEGAEQSFLRAIELKGKSSAEWWYAWELATLGRFPEALAHVDVAYQADPLSASTSEGVGVMHHFAGDDERAIRQLELTLELFPDRISAYQPLGMILCEHGEFERGIALLEKLRELTGALAPLVYGYALAGRLDEARRLLRELEERARTQFVPPLEMALAHVALGQHDEAFEWIERAYELRWATLPGFIAVYPPAAPLRSDPRAADLLRRIGFPQS